MARKKLMLIGWDSADWKFINKLIDKGLMPNMLRLLQNGAYGNLATLDPPFSPMLWTSIATGVRPDKHGILGFTEPTPDRLGVRPVFSTSRKVKAVWNILTQKNYKTHVVGWWPSHPAEPINGIMISNLYQKVKPEKMAPLAENVVHPTDLHRLFAHLRVHPSELTDQHLLPFVPRAAEINQDEDKKLFNIAKNIAEASSIHAAATWIAENKDWDFLALYLDTLDHFGHGFMNFHPPKMKHVSQYDFDMYNNVMTAAYRFHDMMLGRLMELAGKDAAIMLISDHGFHSDHLRPELLPDEPAGPASQHREFGIFCMSGAGIKKDERIYGASLIDITPTILSFFKLPVGKDMDGTALNQVFSDNRTTAYIDSWELVEGKDGRHPKEIQENTYDTAESLKQLVELGYIEEPDENMAVNVERTIDEAQYNLARVYIGAKKYKNAIDILEKLNKKIGVNSRYHLRLADSYGRIGNIDRAEELLNELRTHLQKSFKSKEELDKIRDEKPPENLSEAELAKFEKDRYKKLNSNLVTASELLSADVQYAELLVQKADYENALKILLQIEKSNAHNSKEINTKIAKIYLYMNQTDKALEHVGKALKRDPENYRALYVKGMAYYKQQNYEAAVDTLLDSINLLYNQPMAHFYLGLSLYDYGDYENAANAFNVVLAINPNFGKARNLLIDIYENHLKNKQLTELHKNFFFQKSADNSEKIIESTPEYLAPSENILRRNVFSKSKLIYVVSGLPRSGTSLMMQMIEASGIPIYTDNVREKDESNPRGYYEHQAVKNIASNTKWLKETVGKTVKIVAQLLSHLPAKYNYKIVFMNRDIHEVITSQTQMLVRDKKVKPDAYLMNLELAFQKTLEQVQAWAKKNYNVELLYINHKDAIEKPKEVAEKVTNFLEIDADIEKMAAVVDKKLHRVKKQNEK